MTRGRAAMLVVASVIVGAGVDLLVGSSPVGFSATVGLGGCVVLVLGSKWIGAHLLRRPDSYYLDVEDLGDA